MTDGICQYPAFVDTAAGTVNYDKYSNPTADKFWQEQSKTMDLARMREATRGIERNTIKDSWAMAIKGSAYVIGWWPYVKAFVVQDAGYYPSIRMEKVWPHK